jgi:hypothetical protein
MSRYDGSPYMLPERAIMGQIAAVGWGNYVLLARKEKTL